jgi:serine/threonine protein kinase
MQLSVADFWKLLAASELLAANEREALQAAFASTAGPAAQDGAQAAEWLVAQEKLTAYQASVLKSGRPGPFVFGPFVVTSRIERGRLARLFRATFEGNQQVLLVLMAQLTNDSRDYESLAELAQAASAIKNPHVTRTHLATRQRGQSFVVTESLAGQSLEEVLSKGRRLTLQQACQVGFQVALGLIALHAEKLVHGGVSPRNVWITSSGAAKLMQFPLVPAAVSQPRLELPLIDYTAPEWFAAEATPDPTVDIYGLGCVLFELLSGRVPFPGGNIEQKRTRHRRESAERLDAINPQVSEELAELVEDMLAKDPILRCESASRVAHLLAPLAAGNQGRTVPPKIEPQTLTPGYGAGQAPQWDAPPQQGPQKSTAAPADPPRSLPNTVRRPTPDGPQRPTPRANEHSAPSIEIAGVVDDPTRREVPDAPFVVTTDSESTFSRHHTRRRSSRPLYVILALSAIALAVIAGVVAMMNRAQPVTVAPAQVPGSVAAGEPADAGATPPPATESLPGADASSGDDRSANLLLVADDGKTLWASPTNGAPIVLDYLPSGAQVIVVLRPAALLGSPEGPKLLTALGPAGAALQSQLQATLGVPLTEVEQLIVGFVPDDTLAPRAAYVMRLKGKAPRDALLAGWGNPTAATHAGRDYFARDGMGYYLPAENERIVAIAPEPMLQQMLELKGKPLLRRGIEQLLPHSDDQRQFTLLLTPSYLLTDGRNLLAGPLAALHAPLREFLDESIAAMLLSADVGEQLFVELRVSAPIDRKPQALKDLLSARWDKIPERVERYVDSLAPLPHGKPVVERFPRMLALARDYTRSGVDDRQVVLSTVLPVAAAHNLILGADLTLLESVAGSASSLAADPPASTPLRSVSEALQQKITLSFPRESLESAVALVAREIDVPIAILGADLQLEGITRNQSVNNFDERDQPAAAVLRKLLLLANPEGKLVYQIKPDNSGRESVQISTRAAVTKRGEPLPQGF